MPPIGPCSFWNSACLVAAYFVGMAWYKYNEGLGGFKLGYLLNFNVARMRDGIVRLVNGL